MGLSRGMDCSRAIPRVWLRIEPRARVAELPCSECNGRQSAALLIRRTYHHLWNNPNIKPGDDATTSITCTALSYANMTVEFRSELPGQNVSHGDGLCVTNATTSVPTVSLLLGFI